MITNSATSPDFEIEASWLLPGCLGCYAKIAATPMSPITKQMGRSRRWIVCALLSAKIKDPDEVFRRMEASVLRLGGPAVARLLQRRGVSKSDRPGGAHRMDLPLTQRTVFSAGKTAELAALAQSTKASHLMIYNSLTPAQRRNLADITGTVVYSFLDDEPFSTCELLPP